MEWHGVNEAAERIGVSANTVYALVAQRRLGHRRVGIHKGRGKIEVSDRHIAAFLESCEIPVVMEHRTPPNEAGKASQPARRAKPARSAQPELRSDGKPYRHF